MTPTPSTTPSTTPITDKNPSALDIRVSVYSIPNAVYLDRLISDLTLYPERATISIYTREYHSSYHINISVKTPYGYNYSTQIYDRHYTISILSMNIERPPIFAETPSITINYYPIIVHLSKNLALKLLDTFITLCYTSHQDSTLAIKHLYDAKQYIQEAHNTY